MCHGHMDAVDAFSTQDPKDEDNEGYGYGNTEGDTMLQPHPWISDISHMTQMVTSL